MTTPRRLYLTATGPSLDVPESDTPYLTLEWDGARVIFGTHSPLNQVKAGDSMSAFADLTYAAARVSPMFQGLHRFAAADPRAHGLVSRPLRHNRAPQMNVVLYGDARPYTDLLGEHPSATHFGLGSREPQGWFLPEADHKAFGTPFLVENSTAGEPERWQLAFVDTDVCQVLVDWDDLTGFRDLIAQMRSMTPDYVETLGVITNEAQYREDRNRYLCRSGRAAAREAFSPVKMRLKPRKASQTVGFALRRYEIELRAAHEAQAGSGYFQTPIYARTYVVDLVDVRRARSLNAAMQVFVHEAYGSDPKAFPMHFDAFASRLADAVVRDGIGAVARVTEPGQRPYLLIGQSVDLMREHASALEVNIEASITPV